MVDLLGGADLAELAAAEDRHAVGDREGFLLVMGDHDGGDAGGLEHAAQLYAHLGAQLGVEVGQRLVEQQQLRLGGQRAGNRDALLLAAGELVRVALRVAAQVDQRQHLGHARGAALARPALQAEGHVLRDAHVRKQRIVLEHHADAALLGADPATAGDDLAGDLDLALVGAVEPGDQAQRGRLAAAAGADDQQDLAGRDLEVELAQRLDLAIALADAAQAQLGSGLCRHGACSQRGGVGGCAHRGHLLVTMFTSRATGSRPTSTMASAGTAAPVQIDSAAICQTQVARVS